MIHLDTNFLILSLHEGSPQQQAVVRWLESTERVRVSWMAWAEFLCGPVNAETVSTATQLFGEPLPVVADDAVEGAVLFNLGGRRRGTLPDCLIAAVAIRMGAALATANLDDFKRFEPRGLRLA